MHVLSLFTLKNEVAIVTGGGTGLGRHIAIALAEAGANIVVTSRNQNQCEEVASHISTMGNKTLAIGMDLTKPDKVTQMVDAAIDKFGRVDILVNNSGVAGPAPILTAPIEAWNHVFAVNITGMFLCSRAVGKFMIDQHRGKIINIASIYGVVGLDPQIVGDYQDISYASSKGAVINFTKDLAAKWGRFGINVNAISPAMFHTAQTEGLKMTWNKFLERVPLGRGGRDDDIKGAIVFLASAASDYVTGCNLPLDGGWLCI